MRAVYLEKKGVLKERDIPVPDFNENEVKIKVKSVGICGSDVHYWEHGKIGNFIVKEPLILGHELAGEVVDKGSNVNNLNIGDLVVVEPGTTCGKCEYCKEGRYNLCPSMAFYATPPYDGAFREYISFDSSLVFKVPDGLSSEMATLVEPLAVGTFASTKAGVKIGDKVIVFGAGVIGLCCMITAFESGAEEVCVVDVRDDRLALAKDLGATGTINVKNDTIPEDAFNVAYECTGVPASLINASKALRPGSKVIGIGLGAESIQDAPIVDMIINEIQLIPVFRYANVFPESLKIIDKNRDKFSRFITHRFNLDEIEKAFLTARDDSTAVKVMVNFY